MFVAIFCFFFTESKSQNYTIEDFKLCLDTFGYKNSISITKQQLLAAKKIEANFNFFHIKSLNIFIGNGCFGGGGTSVIYNKGNIINSATKKYFERIAPKTLITIIAEGVNNSGKKIQWGDLNIMIVE